MTELLAFAERSPWWTLAYLMVICASLEAIAAALGARRR